MVKEKNNLTWEEQSDYFEKNDYWLAKSRKLALKILTHIKREKISQKDLANKLGVKPQQINKIVRGGANNMTFQTICKLERELGIELITIPSAIPWADINNTVTAEAKIIIFPKDRGNIQRENDYVVFEMIAI